MYQPPPPQQQAYQPSYQDNTQAYQSTAYQPPAQQPSYQAPSYGQQQAAPSYQAAYQPPPLQQQGYQAPYQQQQPMGGYTNNTVPMATPLSISDPMMAKLSASGKALLRQTMSGRGTTAFVTVSAPAPLRFDLPVSREMFEMYDRAGQQISEIDSAAARIAQLDSTIAAKQRTLDAERRRIIQVKSEEDTLQKRIYRNEHPHFLHYLQVDRYGKVNRLKGEMQNLENVEATEAQAIQALEAEVTRMEKERDQLRTIQGSKAEMERGRKMIFDRVIATVPPSPALLQLQDKQRQIANDLDNERSLELRIEETLREIHTAIAEFQRALRLLQSANSMNLAAEREAERDMRWGQEFDYTEMMEQNRRDDLINEAIPVAASASQAFSQAIATFPAEAKARYPLEAAQIGKVPVPRLRGADYGDAVMDDIFYGAAGAEMNDIRAGRKIHEDILVVERCMAVISGEVQFIERVKNALQANCSRMQSQIANLKSQEVGEHKVMFEQTRRQYIA